MGQTWQLNAIATPGVDPGGADIALRNITVASGEILVESVAWITVLY